MLVLSQKMHICTYNQSNFSGDRPSLETLSSHWPPKLQVLELPLFGDAYWPPNLSGKQMFKNLKIQDGKRRPS